MSYVKLYKVVTDGPIGYQTFNQAALNNDEMRTQMRVEHGSEDPLTSFHPPTFNGGNISYGPNYHRLGRHDVTNIPRTVAAAPLVLNPNYSLDITLGWTGDGISSITRNSVGFYTLTVVGLSTFWGVASCLAGQSLTNLPPVVRSFQASSATGGKSGLWVTIYSLDSGDFVPADCSFWLALYGTP